MNSRTNQNKENTFVNAQTNILKETTLTINANNLNFYSDKQWEEYDILTKLDGYELDYQDNSAGWIKVVLPTFYSGDGTNTEGGWYVSDVILIHKDGRIEHV